MTTMKPAVRGIIGKQIEHVVVKAGPNSPRSQVFLVFSDGTYFEFFSFDGDIKGAGSLDAGGLDKVRNYMPERRVVFEA